VPKTERARATTLPARCPCGARPLPAPAGAPARASTARTRETLGARCPAGPDPDDPA